MGPVVLGSGFLGGGMASVPAAVWWIAGTLSVLTMVGSAVVLPIVIVRMGADYFLEDRHPGRALKHQHPVWRAFGLVTKNVLGALLFLAGLVMCFTPGQGLLSMLMGLVLMDFPGKRNLELALIRRPSVHRSLNWIREKAGANPLLLPRQELSGQESEDFR